MTRHGARRLLVPVVTGFSFGIAFAHWSLRRFDGAAWTALTFGLALSVFELLPLLLERRGAHRNEGT